MNDPAIEKRAEMYALSLQVIANKDRYIRELTDMLTDVSHSWRLACNGGGWEQIERALKEVVKWEEDQQ